jgi:hypothetical protein
MLHAVSNECSQAYQRVKRDFVELILKRIPCNSSDSSIYKNLTDPQIVDEAYYQLKSQNQLISNKYLLGLKRKCKNGTSRINELETIIKNLENENMKSKNDVKISQEKNTKLETKIKYLENKNMEYKIANKQYKIDVKDLKEKNTECKNYIQTSKRASYRRRFRSRSRSPSLYRRYRSRYRSRERSR